MRSMASGSRPRSFGAIDFVHIGFDGLRQEERLAEADEPLVGVDAQPEEVGELLEPDRFDGGDLHGRASVDPGGEQDLDGVVEVLAHLGFRPPWSRSAIAAAIASWQATLSNPSASRA